MTAPAPGAASGLGALLLSTVDHVELGTHHGRRLRARVQRRGARLLLGRGGRFSFALGHTRPVAIEVIEVATDGRRYDLPVPRPRDPWLAAAQRVLALTLGAALLLAWAARRRATKEAGHE